jgi:hypothetical protein
MEITHILWELISRTANNFRVRLVEAGINLLFTTMPKRYLFSALEAL